jgi:hypothetical protein
MNVRTRWDPHFHRASPLFWPIAPAAASLARYADWPEPDDLTKAFAGGPVRFVAAAPRPRRGPAPAEPKYDARIATVGEVATRKRSWHDLLNALVWVSFPQAKLALHARQHRLIAARPSPTGARTPEQDAVAMIDEGGVVVLRARAGGAERALIFGHAIYEGLVCGGPPKVRAAGYVTDVDSVTGEASALVAAADAALAALLERDAPIARGELETRVVDEGLAAFRAALS